MISTNTKVHESVASGHQSAEAVMRPRFFASRYRGKDLAPADTWVAYQTCPACVTGHLVPIASLLTRDGQPTIERALCESCGHAAFRRMPTAEWFQTFYRSEFDTVRKNPAARDYARITDVLVPHMPEGPARILDIGCGYGYALQTFQRLGHRHLYGLEPGQRRADTARSNGFKVGQTSVESMLDDPTIAEGAPYDTIYSWHALEHVVDIQRAMRNMAEALRPGGVLFISVPHIEAEHLIQMAHFLPHIHSFSNESLRALMESQGLEVVYEDSAMRMIGRKPQLGEARRERSSSFAPNQAGPDARTRARLKFIRDFAMRTNASVDSDEIGFSYAYYRGSREILEPSYGEFQELPPHLKVAFKLATNGEGRLGKVGHRVGASLLRAGMRQLGPFFVGSASVRMPEQGSVPRVELVYDADHVVAWYK